MTTLATPEELTKRATLLRNSSTAALRADDRNITISTNGAYWMADQLDQLAAMTTKIEALTALLVGEKP